jgi:hypothetical protein
MDVHGQVVVRAVQHFAEIYACQVSNLGSPEVRQTQNDHHFDHRPAVREVTAAEASGAFLIAVNPSEIREDRKPLGLEALPHKQPGTLA